MSDYLRGVVTRVLAPSRLLQPRVPAPFESSAPAILEHLAVTSPAPPVSPSVTPALRREPRRDSHAGDDAPAALHSVVANVDVIERQAFAPAVTRTENSNTFVHEQLEPPGALPAATPPAMPGEQVVVRPVDSAVAVFADPQVPHTPAPPTAALIQPVAARPLAPQPRIASIGRLPGTRQRDRRHEESRVAAASAPIEIIIGRIDVRAVVASPPAPARPRAKAPLMSLDDYLATRGGGA